MYHKCRVFNTDNPVSATGPDKGDSFLWVANWQLRRYRQLIKSTTVRLPAIRANVSVLPFAVVAHLGACSASEGAVNLSVAN